MKKYLLTIILFITDIILKQIALGNRQIYFLIPKLLAFQLFKNRSLGFSIYFPQILIIIFSWLILLGLIILVLKKQNYFFPAALIFLGAISNLFDRLSHGFVIDYFYLFPISYFNLADLLIFSGVILFIIKLSAKPKIS